MTERSERGTKLARVLAAATLVSGAGAVYGPASATAVSRLQRDTDAIRATGVTGVLARVSGPGGRNVSATSGVANVRTGRPVPPGGYFRIASNTKAFTATVVLQLVAEHRLSLSDTVEHWLPGLVRGNGNDGRTISVRDLLGHTSGIHDDIPGFASVADYYEHRYDVYTAGQMVARAMSHPPDFPAGQRWQYSNVGYIILGMMVEKVTGHSWYAEVRDRILRPLRLRDTFWPGLAPDLPRPHAEGYLRFAEDGLVDVTKGRDAYSSGSAGGLVSTSADLGRFFTALLEGRLLPPAQLALMKETMPVGGTLARLWPGARDGLGIFSRPLSCGGVYWTHAGDMPGYMTRDGFSSDGRRGVVVSMSSEPTESFESVKAQDDAAAALIDHALCDAG
jgi:D-alanyl-D-alanine carboxypeptidase